MKYITAGMIALFFFVIAGATVARFAPQVLQAPVAEATFQSIDIQQLPDIPTPTSTATTTGFTLEEVAKHNHINDCWMVIRNNVYDVTDYAAKHPAGIKPIADNCGKEVTGLFARIHSNRAWDLLADLKIGELAVAAPSGKAAAVARAFEEANPGAKVMRIEPEPTHRGWKLEVTKAEALYEVHLSQDGVVTQSTIISQKTPGYIWRADKAVRAFGDFEWDAWLDDDDEYEEYEEYDDYEEWDDYDDDEWYDDDEYYERE